MFLYNTMDALCLSMGIDPNTPPALFAAQPKAKPGGSQCKDCVLYLGDNLSHLLSLALSHSQHVDLCYIDPPYNTGSSFLYNDSRQAPKVGPFGRHTAWMQFMLPRLVAAKEILSEDGVIAVSIDDYEQVYLRLLMDHIFGEQNFIGNIVVCRSKNGKGSKKNVAANHEYLVIYGKSKLAHLRGAPDNASSYDKKDEYGLFRIDGLFRKKGEASLRSDRPNLFYPLYYDTAGNVYVDAAPGLKKVLPLDAKGVERRWLWTQATTRKNLWKLYASANGVIYVKNYSHVNKRTKIRTLWNSTAYYTERATAELKHIFGEKIFDTPKPMSFIKDILDQMGRPDSVIMDFFAGSGTTAHAAHELNLADGGTRKTILMECKAEIPPKHIAREYGFKRVSDITIKRLDYINRVDRNFRYQVVHHQSNKVNQIRWHRQ